jgi:light-regulated signal transduction histidine kinase (bacteriophytochrome)/GGDEF domain-containing protein
MLLVNELLRCEDEQIHIPGLIQPVGSFIVLRRVDQKISHVSENIGSSRFLEQDFYVVLSELQESLEDFLLTVAQMSRKIYFNITLDIFKQECFDVVFSSYDEAYIIIELLPRIKTANFQNQLITTTNEFMFDILRCENLHEVYAKVVLYIQQVSEYERVMIYKFDSDYNGEVIAEEKVFHVSSYLHLHYPASDIPPQARELYLKNTTRIIHNVEYIPVNILSREKKPLDMSLSYLRSVSPIHLEYMKNMGVHASMTLSIIIDNKLWGLIACHHSEEFTPTMEVTQACERITSVATSMIKIFENKIFEAQKSQFIAKIDTILLMLQQHRERENIGELLGENVSYFKSLFEADGLLFCYEDMIYSTGLELSDFQKKELVDFIQNLVVGSFFCTDTFNKHAQGLEESIFRECSGVLAFRLNNRKMFIWTKKEQLHSVDWGGNPIKKNDELLSPRKSFEKFSQQVTNQSLPWINNTQENIDILVKKMNDFFYISESHHLISQQRSMITSLEHEKSKNLQELIEMLVTMIEKRDSYTAGHTQRVSNLCLLIAQEMQISEHEIELLRQASKLHDIGKVVIPDAVLLKPGKLTQDEYKLIQLHLTTGYEILSKIEYYKEIATIMLYHHEKYDGSGYPTHARGDEIPMLSHIMIVADAFDAMTSNRIYQKTKTMQDAMDEIMSLRGTWYHPDVVDALKNVYTNKKILLEKSTQLPLTKMENERFAYFFKDPLTGAFNEAYLWLVLTNKFENINPQYFFLIELHNISQYNKKYGWNSGNMFISKFANKIESMQKNLLLFRLFGDDFGVCFEEEEAYKTFLQRWEDIEVDGVYSTIKSIAKEEFIRKINIYN